MKKIYETIIKDIERCIVGSLRKNQILMFNVEDIICYVYSGEDTIYNFTYKSIPFLEYKVIFPKF